MVSDEFTKAIDDIPVDGEWWKSSNRNSVVRIGKELLDKGFTEEEAIRIISNIYYAAAGEYGA